MAGVAHFAQLMAVVVTVALAHPVLEILLHLLPPWCHTIAIQMRQQICSAVLAVTPLHFALLQMQPGK